MGHSRAGLRPAGLAVLVCSLAAGGCDRPVAPARRAAEAALQVAYGDFVMRVVDVAVPASIMSGDTIRLEPRFGGGADRCAVAAIIWVPDTIGTVVTYYGSQRLRSGCEGPGLVMQQRVTPDDILPAAGAADPKARLYPIFVCQPDGTMLRRDVLVRWRGGPSESGRSEPPRPTAVSPGMVRAVAAAHCARAVRHARG